MMTSGGQGAAVIPRFLLPVLLGLLWFAPGCAHRAPADRAGEVAAVQAVLAAQEQAWNAGDLAGFMQGYARGAHTRFASGGDVTLGWQTVFDRYQKRYGDRAGMGRLTFSDVSVELTGPDTALVFGHWALQREHDAPRGLFTLLFRRTADGWRIIHDHTSSATP